MQRIYLCIDLKSFYASVQCVERGLDPLTTHLVVADESRTEKTICLAVAPALKQYGIPGRPRLFEVIQRVEEINRERLSHAPGGVFSGMSSSAPALAADSSLGLEFLAAQPRMSYYMSYSTRIFDIYCRFVSPQDIHVYSIDEVFIDLTGYLATYGLTPVEMAMKLIRAVLQQTGITATAGIGTNMYLAKVAMDIVAKKMPADENGVRIAQLDEMSYRRTLWTHRPLTDFWRVGKGIARKLQQNGMYTMGDIAWCSLGKSWEKKNEDLLYKLFGINAELLIDHAWGWEPATIADIKAYRPESSSVSSGQVLSTPYPFKKARLVIREMADAVALDLVDRGVMTDQICIAVGYDVDSLTDGAADYTGPVERDMYGRRVPKPVNGSLNLPRMTSSSRMIVDAVTQLFDSIVSDKLLVRRMYVVANHLGTQDKMNAVPQQLDLFTDYQAQAEAEARETEALEREKRRQQAILGIKKKFGKNALLIGMSLQEGATAAQRNSQIGGHKA